MAAVAMDDAPCTVELARKVLTKLNREPLTACDKLSASRPLARPKPKKIGASEGDAPRDPARHREVYGRAIEPK